MMAKKKTILQRLTWKTLDSKKQQKFNTKNWRNSSWKKELEKKMNFPGVYCLHDDKRIFYIGISTDGVMKNRWDPTSDSSHDSGQQYKKSRKKTKKKLRAGGKWAVQGKFASGGLVFKVKESGKTKLVSSEPKLSCHPFKKYNPKFVGKGKRKRKKWSKASQNQKQKIQFIEYMMIRRAALIHQFGGLKEGDRITSAKEHKTIKKGRDYVQNKTILSTGWTLMNKKDGIPFQISKENIIEQKHVPKKTKKRANKFRIRIICGGSKNPLHGTNGLFNKAVIFDKISENSMEGIKNISGTISLIKKAPGKTGDKSISTTAKKAAETRKKNAAAKLEAEARAKRAASAKKAAATRRRNAIAKKEAEAKEVAKKAADKKAASAKKKAPAKKKPAAKKKAPAKKKPAAKKKAPAKKKPAAKKKAPAKKKKSAMTTPSRSKNPSKTLKVPSLADMLAEMKKRKR